MTTPDKSSDVMVKPCSALSVVVFLMLVGSVAADTKATKEMLTHSTTTESLYLGTLKAVEPAFTLDTSLCLLSLRQFFRVHFSPTTRPNTHIPATLWLRQSMHSKK
ncbi:TPA: hypothetical protein ACWXAD_004927 [Klebsiella quasipneumoniae subsp. similipneumoniae]